MPGATLVTAGDERIVYDLTDEQAECLLGAAKSALESQASSSVSVEIGGARATILLALINPRIRLLVLGAGLDAEPVTRLADELGWRVTVVDHRPAYIESGNFETAERVVCCPAEEMSVNVDLPKFDGAIVMSHHLVSDRTYLTQLSDSGMQYVGLLGPIDRRRRLLKELGDAASGLQDRLHGPAGVDIGAQGPAAIALSILTEMYGVLADR
jgi:xanthine/CO dehydrogenase XdhC/CoxF family maturation factor